MNDELRKALYEALPGPSEDEVRALREAIDPVKEAGEECSEAGMPARREWRRPVAVGVVGLAAGLLIGLLLPRLLVDDQPAAPSPAVGLASSPDPRPEAPMKELEKEPQVNSGDDEDDLKPEPRQVAGGKPRPLVVSSQALPQPDLPQESEPVPPGGSDERDEGAWLDDGQDAVADALEDEIGFQDRVAFADDTTPDGFNFQVSAVIREGRRLGPPYPAFVRVGDEIYFLASQAGPILLCAGQGGELKPLGEVEADQNGNVGTVFVIEEGAEGPLVFTASPVSPDAACSTGAKIVLVVE